MADRFDAMHATITGVINADRLEQTILARLGDYIDQVPDLSTSSNRWSVRSADQT